MNVTVFSKDNCPNCVKAMVLLSDYNPTVFKVGVDISRDEFFIKFPGIKTLPQIIINGEHVGGFTALEQWVAFNNIDDDF